MKFKGILCWELQKQQLYMIIWSLQYIWHWTVFDHCLYCVCSTIGELLSWYKIPLMRFFLSDLQYRWKQIWHVTRKVGQLVTRLHSLREGARIYLHLTEWRGKQNRVSTEPLFFKKLNLPFTKQLLRFLSFLNEVILSWFWWIQNH